MRWIVRPSVVEQVASKLKEQILEGTFRTGERLPSHRALAERLGVSHETARAAVQHLVARGYVRGCVGSGMRVAPVERLGGLEVLLDFVCFALSKGKEQPALSSALRDLEDLHRVVFGEVSALAAVRHDRTEADALALSLGDLETELARAQPEQAWQR